MRTIWNRAAALWIVGTTLAFSGSCRSGIERRVSRILEWEREPSTRNVERIRGGLQDDEAQVRAGALAALVRLRVPDAVERSRAALADADGGVRATAAKCLLDLSDRDAMPLLSRVALDDPDWRARRGAVEAVGRLGAEDSVEPLARSLGDPSYQVRLAAVEAVTRLGPTPALAELAKIAASETSWEVRAAAAEALGRVTSSDAYAPVKEALDDPNEFVRAAASAALRELRKKGVPEPEEAARLVEAIPQGPVLPGQPALQPKPRPKQGAVPAR